MGMFARLIIVVEIKKIKNTLNYMLNDIQERFFTARVIFLPGKTEYGIC